MEPATPESRRSSLITDFSDGITGRRRHASDSGLPLSPFSDSFSQAELEEFLKYFASNKIHKWKIYQHLIGTQIIDSKEARNYPDVNTKSTDTGWTALHVACINGYKDLVKVLIQCKANPKLTNNGGSSPIHFAIVNKSKEIVETLLEHDSSLVCSFNTINGFYPLHTAAFHRLIDISKVLIENGASVDQNTELTDISPNDLTVFHIAASKLAKIKTRKIKDRNEIAKRLTDDFILTNLRDATETDIVKIETHKILNLFLSKMKRERIQKVNYCKGSILHSFCSVDFSDGIRTILTAPFLHPPDPQNIEKITPLVLSLSIGHLQSAKELLYYDVDVNLIYPHPFHMTALQLLIHQALTISPLHLDVVQLLLDKGADPTQAYDTDSPVVMATMTTLDVKLLEKFLEYLDSSNINTKDKVTGETILHHAVLNSSADKIAKILNKGADIMIDNSVPENIETGVRTRKPEIPMEVSLYNQTGQNYFEALQIFGIYKQISIWRNSNTLESSGKVLQFLKTHLNGGSFDKNLSFLQEIFIILQSPDYHFTREDIFSIIHFKEDKYENSIFRKTALSWANENEDRITSLELLKLERKVHVCLESDQKCLINGLQCLKSNLSSDKLLPWIIETYQGFYKKPAHIRWSFAIMTVIFELLMLSYIPYMYDLYSDIDLAQNYYKIGDENSTFDESELWVCGDQNLEGFCARDFQETVEIRKSFYIAFWITSSAIIVSTFSYLVSIIFHSNPRFISKLEKRFAELETQTKLNKYIVRLLWKTVWLMLVITCKVFWPLIHFARKIRYSASTKKSQEKQAVIESDTTWQIVKTVEHGLEASLQLFLGVWLLKPYFPIIHVWSTRETVIRVINGIANFITFDVYPACYIEKALGKVCLTLIFLSISASFNKCTKHGVPVCEKPFRLFPMFISIFVQIIGRLYAFRILFLFDSPIQEWKLLIFFCIHFLAIFIIKILFEESPVGKRPLRKRNIISTFLNIGKFLISVFSSSIIMVHLHDSKKNVKKQLFMSHACFFILILIEHFFIILLPFITSNSFPPENCLKYESYISVALAVMILWFLGVLFHVVHYSWSHPWAAINGPEKSVSSVLARLRSKKGSQMVYTEDYQNENQMQEGYQEVVNRDDIELEAMTNGKA